MRGATLFFWLFLVPFARAEDLVLALSTRDVAIHSTYSGANITLFGLIERDAQTVPRAGDFDIVVRVRGPSGDVVLQHKEKFGFLWLTNQRRRFQKVPLYFATYSSHPLTELVDQEAQQRLKLNLSHFVGGPNPHEREQDFIAAFSRLQRKDGFLIEGNRGVQMLRPNLFTLNIPLPGRAHLGLYVVDVTLLSSGIPLKNARSGFVVYKVGFDAFVASAAKEHPWFYGMFTVFMAVFLGFLANVIFRKD